VSETGWLGRLAPPRPGEAAGGRASFLPFALLALVIGGFCVLPVLRLLLVALAPGGVPDLSLFAGLLGRPAVQRAIFNTLDTSLSGMALAVVLGLPAALLCGLTDLPGRKLMALLLLLPMMVAPQITALSWLHLFAVVRPALEALHLLPPASGGNPLLGRGGIIALYGLQETPIVFITLRAGLARLPVDFVEAARLSGAGPLRLLRDIALPLIRPYLVAAAALAFVGCVGNFGIPALLGMPANYLTLSTFIYQQLTGFGPGVLPQMAGLSVLVGGLALLGIGVQSLALGGRAVRFAGGRTALLPLGDWRWPAAGIAFGLVAIVVLLPLLALLMTALVPAYGVPLTPQTVTLDNFIEVLGRQAATGRAFLNSAFLAGSAALLLGLGAIPLALAAQRLPPRLARLAGGFADLPYALPGVALAIATILIFLRPLPLVGSLYATVWIILLAYLMRFLSLALKPVGAAIGQLPSELIEAAASAGAGPARRLFTIIVPLTLPAAMAGALLIFMIAFGELTVSSLLWSGGHETVGVILFSLEGAGLATQAAAIGVTTVAVVLLVLAAVDRLGRRLPAGVLPWG
jgi:iron(III) transport system permease protein